MRDKEWWKWWTRQPVIVGIEEEGNGSQQEGYQHTVNAYHLVMNIYAECEEFKALWRLVDEMVEKGLPATARTFNILIRTCGEAGLAKSLVVESYIQFLEGLHAKRHC